MRRHGPWLVAALLAAACATAPEGAGDRKGEVRQADPLPDAAAVPTRRVPPEYPKAAASQRLEGCVTVSFEVLPDGRADRYVVVDSVPKGVFDQATLLALNEWRFQPPARPGRYAQTIEYRMDSGGKHAERACARPTFADLNPLAAAQRQLKVLSQVMPAAPAGGPPGCVVVQFVIHPDGSVGEIAVVDAKPGTRYVPATLAALKQWRFESFEPPALRGQQAFTFDGEQVRLPDDAVRASFAVVGKDGALRNEPCSATPGTTAEKSKG